MRMCSVCKLYVHEEYVDLTKVNTEIFICCKIWFKQIFENKFV